METEEGGWKMEMEDGGGGWCWLITNEEGHDMKAKDTQYCSLQHRTTTPAYFQTSDPQAN